MFIHYMIIAILPTALVIAAVHDLLEMKIPNVVCLVLLSTYPVAAMVFQVGWNSVFSTVLYSSIILFIGFLGFMTIQFGAGDVKLLAVSSLWIGPAALPAFFVNVGLSGGILAILVLFIRGAPFIPAHAAFDLFANLQRADRRIPYGIAIAAGGLLVLPETTFVQLVSRI